MKRITAVTLFLARHFANPNRVRQPAVVLFSGPRSSRTVHALTLFTDATFLPCAGSVQRSVMAPHALVGEPRESDPLALPLAGKPDGSGYADPAGIFRAFHVLFF